MNQLCDELAKFPQVVCTVEDHHKAAEVEIRVAASVAAGQRLVLVGHSWGAHAALRIANAVKANIPLMVTVDPNWFPTPPTVPQNVEIVLNYYQDFDVLGRAVLQPSPNFRGKLYQFRLNEPHVLIDRSEQIHAEVIARIGAILASPHAPPVRLKPSNSEPGRQKRRD